MRAVGQVVLVVAIAAAPMAAPPVRIDTAALVQPVGLNIESIQPARGVRVGVAHPVVVTFAGFVADRDAFERALKISSRPAMTGRFEWLEDNVVQWVPDRYWPAHSTILLSVGLRKTEFQTGPEVLGVADIAEHTFTVTIDGSSAGLPAPHHLPHAGEDGVLLASMGRPEYPTPVGSYTVLSKDRSVLMDSSSVGVPVTAPDGYRMDVDYAVRITRRGIFVHSAPWAVPAMGVENVSHGCISLTPAAAEWYFNTVEVGDPVIVKDSAADNAAAGGADSASPGGADGAAADGTGNTQ